jgi:raffinose/stachyose/melibiose transport system permease protein
MEATGALARRISFRALPKAPPSLVGFGFFIPAVSVVAAFQLYPLVRGLVLSFEHPRTGGFTTANYERMLHDDAWGHAVVNSGKILLLVPIFVVVPLILAFTLYQRFRGWRFFRAAFFLSWMIPPVIVGYMFVPLLEPYGPLNSVFDSIGLGKHGWLGDPSTALWTVMAIFLWWIFGLGVGIYLAGLATIPEELVESARLEGASQGRILRYIVAPLMWPTIALWSVTVVSALLLGLYGFIYSLTGGGPSFSTLTPEYYIVSVMLREVNPNYAAALGTTLFVAVFGIVALQLRFVYRRVVAT